MEPLECVITVREDAQLVSQVFLAEEKTFNHKRSRYDVVQKGDEVIITIVADDPTALRATMTSVTRVLGIVHKMKVL